MEAAVWVLGPYAPSAQLSWRGGFILKAEGAYHKQLTTGVASWRVAELKNVTMRKDGLMAGRQSRRFPHDSCDSRSR